MATAVSGVATAQEVTGSAWVSGSIILNPGVSTLLAQTSSLTSGQYLLGFAGWCEAATRFKVAIRNSADSADVKSVEIPIPANSPVSFTVPTMFTIAAGESFKVTNALSVGVSDNAQVSIFYAKIGG